MSFASEVLERSRSLEAVGACTDDIRASARARLESTGLPSGRKLETWKYTPITPFYSAAFVAVAAEAPRPVEARFGDGIETPTGVTLGRRMRQEPLPSQTNGRVDLDRYPLAVVNTALVDDVLLVDVAPMTSVDLPLEITFPSDSDAVFSRVLVRLGHGSRLTLVEHHARSAGSRNRVVEIDIAAGASLRHQRVESGAATSQWSLLAVDVAEAGSYEGAYYAFAGNPRRSDVHIRLLGQDARADLQGALAASGTETLDLQIVMDHFGKATRSRQKFHALAAGRGTLTFNGRIEIHPGADGSDAALQNRNLLLTPTARVNAKPGLEIHTRDVRCSHGATVGRLDPGALFYLRSRGIDAATAQLMLMQAFIAQCLTPEAREAGVDRYFAEVFRA